MGGDVGGSRGRPPKGYKRSDERIREDICDQISDHPDLDASDVEVKVQNGEVVLTGTVRERRFKHQLETLAERISGVTDVRNEIRLYREQQQQGEAKAGGLSSSERSTTGAAAGATGAAAGTSGGATSIGATSTSETKNNESRRNAS
ncbi:BON domain-containing protein [Sorangium sp. So ce341]|uniref:BON domain-containing protein n=1 Tax=Sorangium sp. So ce341 TaxID=3133302 RepID=UPI003F5F43CE